MPNRLCILFLCVHNSARSQLAEGLLRAMAGDRVEVFSAGSEPSTVHPLALQVLRERGINAATHRSKNVAEFAHEKFDYVITLCAEEVCPVFLNATQKLHWALPDPAVAQPEDQVNAFRQTADELENRLRQFLKRRFPPSREQDRSGGGKIDQFFECLGAESKTSGNGDCPPIPRGPVTNA